jgi:hypothetical protein
MTPKIMLRGCLKFLGIVLLVMAALQIYTELSGMTTAAGSFKAMVTSSTLKSFTPLIIWLVILLGGSRFCYWLAAK